MTRYRTTIKNSSVRALAVGSNACATSNSNRQSPTLTRSEPPSPYVASALRTAPGVRKEVFICYSHSDRRWLDRLQVHLSPLVRGNLLNVWADTRLKAGSRWREELDAALGRANIAILMVSADFLASRFIVEHELPPLLARAANDGLQVIPLIVGRSLFDTTELCRYQAANSPTRPLSEMDDDEVDEALVRLVRVLLVT